MSDLSPEIEAKLEQHLESISGIPDIAWENGSYNPTDVEYVEPYHIPTLREPASRGNMFRTLYRGVFRIECLIPRNKGTGAARLLTSKIIEAFEANTDFTLASGKYATVRDTYKETGIPDGAFYRVPVNVRWYAYD
jgi:hypothetical protein